ncbi:MAG: response regulator, partial [Chloroflexi bacterium]|nr:response regulator [Chloroflexota bacterium]
MKEKIRILLLEDNPDDAFMVERELKKSGDDFHVRRVETEQDFRDALDLEQWDLVLADFNLPTFGGPQALEIVNKEHPDLPLVLMSGEVKVEEAVQALNRGACDFIQKQVLVRLGPVVQRVLDDVRKKKEHRLFEQQLINSEYKYRTMFETMTQGILYFDMQGCIFSSNPSAREILGLSTEEVNTRTFNDERFRLIQEDGEPFEMKQLPVAMAISMGKPIRGAIAGVFNQKQNKYRWIRVDIIPQYEQNSDEPTYLYAAIEDITEQKQAEINRRKLLEELSQSQKMESVGRLAGGVAHDFNNLLTAIIGNADLAMNTIEPDNVVYDDLREIKTTAERAADLTRQLLAFSRRQIVELKIIDINHVLLEI